MTGERRESFRCQVPASEVLATLGFGKHQTKSCIVDQSAGGYTIVCKEKPGAKVGQSVTLTTSAGCCDAKIAHITRQEDEFRIGLKRLGESRPATGQWLAELMDTTNLMRLSVIFVLCSSFFAWGALLSGGSGWFGGTPADAHETQDGKAESSHSEQELALKMIEMGPLDASTMTNDLGLSGEQRQQVYGIVRQATAALSALYEDRDKISPDDWSEYGLQIMKTAADEIHSVMTDEQHVQWLEVLQSQATQADSPVPSE